MFLVRAVKWNIEYLKKSDSFCVSDINLFLLIYDNKYMAIFKIIFPIPVYGPFQTPGSGLGSSGSLISIILTRSRIMYFFTLKSIAACRLAEGKKTYLAFLDFRKAFDTVWRDGLLRAAWDIGLRGKIWRIIDSFYDKVQGRVRMGEIEPDFFDIDEGVKQRCVLSLVLFCIFMHEFTKLL